MRKAESYQRYLDGLVTSKQITEKECEIVSGYIDHRNTVSPTSTATRIKQACQGAYIIKILHDNKVRLDTATVKDFENVAKHASSGVFTKNSRQTKIVLIKALATYINENYHSLRGMGSLKEIAAGSASRHTKDILSPEEWGTVINTPMSAKDRAMIAMLYDGYHRPTEILLLKWSYLKINKTGGIEYDVLFKTEKKRTIVMKPQATSALELWRQELGAKIGDDTPIFSGNDGNPYQTITILKQLCNRLKAKSGIKKIMPSIFRNSAITHDIQAGLPVSYVCMRAWGESYNERINVYADPDSSKMQRDQHDKNGITTAKISPGAMRKASEIRECPSCQAANPATMEFCGLCGSGLSESAIAMANVIRQLVSNPDTLIEYANWLRDRPK